MATKPRRKKAVKGQCKSEENPWTYQHNLPLLLESDKLTKDELLSLTCRDKYCIKSMFLKVLEIEMMNYTGYLETW